jgi:hypothetical protein
VPFVGHVDGQGDLDRSVQEEEGARDGEQAEDRLESQRDDTRDREQQADLGIGQPELVADQRPGGLARAEDELVE